MPQTMEAINHARAAEVPIIVAVNKMDLPNANLERVKKGLSEYGLAPEEWGGSTVFAPVSARTKEGIPHLIEMILLQADMFELKANPKNWRAARSSNQSSIAEEVRWRPCWCKKDAARRRSFVCGCSTARCAR